uniref:F-box/kelch-repeat protein SKIP11-like n=1 Tax=Erigeron canadensis TaxID=72917 RepID=UPI001CB92157|nr:F-box/kelch-repeat protein SKIP11-like [Erigeron canadensis]
MPEGVSNSLEEADSQGSKNSSHMKDDNIGMETLASELQKMPLLLEDDGTSDDHALELNLAYGDHDQLPSREIINKKISDDDLGLLPGSHDSDASNSLPSAIGRENSIKQDLIGRRPRNYHASNIVGDHHLNPSSGESEHEYWVYFACHLLKWEAFNPDTKTWMSHLPVIQADKCFELSDKESMGVGTQLLVLGKDVLGQIIYKYNVFTNSWSEARLMNKPRCLFGSASLGKTAIFAGGVDGNGKITDAVEIYDSETGAWETLPSLLKPRKMSSGVYMDGKFYVIGGSGGNDMKPYDCGEEYDLATKKWRAIPNMSPGGGGGSSAPPLLAVVDNELYAADCAAMEVKKYDKKRNLWWSIGSLPERASNIDGWGIAFRGCGKRVVIVGGPRTHTDTHVDIYSWVPSEGPPEWTIVGRKKSDSFVYNCAIMCYCSN